MTKFLAFALSGIFSICLFAENTVDQEKNLPSLKWDPTGVDYCTLDTDCVLQRCMGCTTKERRRVGPTEPPCMQYGQVNGKEVFVCKCISNKCETKPI